MRTYALENRGRAPLYEYLYRCIRGDILDGTLTAGERLPSKRALAEHLHISVMTVEGAYQQLEAEGYVYTQPKRGFFVAEVERPRPAVPAPPAPEAPPEAPVWRLAFVKRIGRINTVRSVEFLFFFQEVTSDHCE